MNLDFTDISSFDTVSLDGLLRALEESNIFNTLEDIAENDISRIDLTCFEQLVSYFINKTGLSSFYQTGVTVDGEILKVSFANSYGWNKEEENNDEIDMLINLVNAFKNSGLSSFTSGDISGLNETQINDLLSSINHSYVLHPSIGGLIKDGYESLSATVKNDMFGGAIPNYYLTHITDGMIINEILLYDTEISYVAKLIPFINDDANNFTNVKTINTVGLKNIYDMLAASKIFNTSAEYEENDPLRRTNKIKTPFESLIFYSINSTGLTSYYDRGAESAVNQATLSSRILDVTFDIDKEWITNESITGENQNIIDLLDVYQSLSFATINDAALVDLYLHDNANYNRLYNAINASYVLQPIIATMTSITGSI